jgi:hypothetical protein
MVLLLLLVLLASGAGTYYSYRKHGPYQALVPSMIVILMIYLLVGGRHIH